jgi:acetylornithine deacetylase/succinyl-diaminopimelate desuccinylase-like protein
VISPAEVVELLQALIRNECVNDGNPDSGFEARSVATLRDFLGGPGLEFEARPGRTSVLYRIPATDPDAPRLTLMGHLDVVPANPEGWSRDPFGAEIVDGSVWGRGAVDMLNLTAAMAVVFKRFLDGTEPPPPGGLAFLAVADEEAGGSWGARFLTERHWDEVACDYLLTEIAYPALATTAGPAYPVSVAEKGPFWRRLGTGGTPGHGSQPYGTDNALLPLTRILTRLADTPSPVAITAEWRMFVDGLGLPEREVSALTDPDRIDRAVEDLFGDRPGFARYVHACTHLTAAPTVLRAGSKMNVIPDAARAEVDIRALPGQDAGTVEEHLRKVAGPDYERLDFASTSTAPVGPLWQAACDAIEELTGSRRVIPTLMPPGTDARFFRARGTRAYGLGLFDDRVSFEDFLAMFHGNDERISVESLGRTAEVLAGVVRRLRNT